MIVGLLLACQVDLEERGLEGLSGPEGEELGRGVPLEVPPQGCPQAEPPVAWGAVADRRLVELSGVVASRRAEDTFWVHEDSGSLPVLTAIDASGATRSRYDLPEELADFEDIALAVDPATATPTLFLGDIGDNGRRRGEIAVWVAEEPDPLAGGALSALRMGLTYPDRPHDAETLLVDPLSFDLYVVTKSSGVASVFVKRAPHDDEGPFELEALGAQPWLPLGATGGDVAPDGTRVVVRDYGSTARLWIRDGDRPLEEAFEAEPCEISIHDEPQGEAIGFTTDGDGIVTLSEGTNPALYHIGW